MVQTLAQEVSALDRMESLFSTQQEITTKRGKQGLEGCIHSGCLSSPPSPRSSPVDTSWWSCLPVTCSPESPHHCTCQSPPSSLPKLGSLPGDFRLHSLQDGFPSSTLTYPAEATLDPRDLPAASSSRPTPDSPDPTHSFFLPHH